MVGILKVNGDSILLPGRRGSGGALGSGCGEEGLSAGGR